MNTHSQRTAGYTVVPFVIAYANELVSDPIGFVPYAGRQRLSYLPSSRPGDWVKSPSARSWEPGILRARVRDLRGKRGERGPERMRKLNVRRQWRCMDKRLCQVCGAPATDPETGLIPWLLTATVFERTGAKGGRTNAPPTCWDCIPRATEECPMLGKSFSLVTAVGVESAGVLADMYRPGALPGTLQPTAHNVFVSWDAPQFHRHALATSQVVELRGLRSVP